MTHRKGKQLPQITLITSCDAASADVNKIYRCSYGDWKEYQDLAMKGRPVWLEWNKMIASTSADRLPEGLTPKDQLFVNGGFVRQNLFTEQSEYDRQSLREMEKVGLRQNIYIKVGRKVSATDSRVIEVKSAV